MKHRHPETAVSPVIAVILMVAITVVLAGVVFVWAMTFTQNQQSAPGTIVFRIEDAEDAASGAGTPATFLTTDEFITITLVGKSKTLDVNDMDVKAQLSNADIKLDLVWLMVDNAAFNPSTNNIMEPGDIAILGITTDGDFSDGDNVHISIYEKDVIVAEKENLIVH